MATHCRWDLLHTPLPADADIAWLGSYRRYTARLTMDRLTIAIAPQQTDRHPLQPHAFSLQPHAPTPACSPTLAPRAYLPATPCAHRSACNPMCPSFHLQPYVPIRLQPHVPICLQPHVPIVPPATLCAYPPAAARAHAPGALALEPSMGQRHARRVARATALALALTERRGCSHADDGGAVVDKRSAAEGGWRREGPPWSALDAKARPAASRSAGRTWAGQARPGRARAGRARARVRSRGADRRLGRSHHPNSSPSSTPNPNPNS